MIERSSQALALYRAARVKDQLDFYAKRSSEYDRAAAQSVAVAAVLLSLTTLTGALAGLDISGKMGWAIAATVIPAISAALAAYDALFGFERVSKLYRDAIQSLHRIKEPDLSGLEDEATAAAEVAAYASAVEAVLRKEQAQWGQLTAELEIPAHRDSPNDA
jgi:hypothetical protein